MYFQTCFILRRKKKHPSLSCLGSSCSLCNYLSWQTRFNVSFQTHDVLNHTCRSSPGIWPCYFFLVTINKIVIGICLPDAATPFEALKRSFCNFIYDWICQCARFKGCQKTFFPHYLILEKVHIEGFQGKSARYEHIVCNPAAAATRSKTDFTHLSIFCSIVAAPNTFVQICTFKV